MQSFSNESYLPQPADSTVNQLIVVEAAILQAADTHIHPDFIALMDSDSMPLITAQQRSDHIFKRAYGEIDAWTDATMISFIKKPVDTPDGLQRAHAFINSGENSHTRQRLLATILSEAVVNYSQGITLQNIRQLTGEISYNVISYESRWSKIAHDLHKSGVPENEVQLFHQEFREIGKAVYGSKQYDAYAAIQKLNEEAATLREGIAEKTQSQNMEAIARFIGVNKAVIQNRPTEGFAMPDGTRMQTKGIPCFINTESGRILSLGTLLPEFRNMSHVSEVILDVDPAQGNRIVRVRGRKPVQKKPNGNRAGGQNESEEYILMYQQGNNIIRHQGDSQFTKFGEHNFTSSIANWNDPGVSKTMYI